MNWKTVSRRDPEFRSYLDGSFSTEERALPVRSLNVETSCEEVTFEIVPVGSIDSPGVIGAAWCLLRPTTWVLSLGPLLVTLLYCLARGKDIHVLIAAFSFAGVISFQAAVTLFKDYYDHIKGRDRLKQKGGNRVIQKGWVRALDVKRAAWALTAFALLCGLPAVATQFSLVAVVAIFAVLAGFEFAFQRLGLKKRGIGEVIAFALTGPLLTTCFAWAITGEAEWAHAALGCVFGSIALMYFHLANFENIMSDDQAGIRTWATRAGFDASKTFFYFTASLVLASMIFHIVVFDSDWRLAPVLAAQVVFLAPLARRVQRLASPLSSELTGIRGEALKLSWLTMAVWAAGYLGVRAMAAGTLP